MDIVEAGEKVFQQLKFNMPLNKVIHVGANAGQEVNKYEKAGISGYHVEALPDQFKLLEERCAKTTYQSPILACCDSEAGISVIFNRTSNSESSSLLDLGRHAVAHPRVTITEKIDIITDTLDNLAATSKLPADPDFLLLDVQGAESRVLEGGSRLLNSPKLWGVVVEVSLDPLYKGGVPFDELYMRHLKPNGFYLLEVSFNKNGWSDALFLKRWWRLEGEVKAPLEMLMFNATTQNIAALGKCTQSALSKWSRGEDDPYTAVSRVPNGSFAFHTEPIIGAFWRVDWSEPALIKQITLFNRVNPASTQDRVIGAEVEISHDGSTWATIYKVERAFGGVDGSPLRISVPEIMAKSLRITQTREEPLHLDHIHINGTLAML